ncbi:MAG: endonuclease, partial [Marinobacter sp.]
MTGPILAGLALALVVVTVLGKVPVHDWWVRACEFPRLQIASLALVLAGLSPLADPPWFWWVLA